MSGTTRVIIAVCLSATLTSGVSAAVMIQLGGINIGYDGSRIVDAGEQNPDLLTNATFIVDNATAGVDSTEVTFDLNIPGVFNLPVGGGYVNSAANGSLHLDLGGGEHLSLTLASAVVSYMPLTSSIQFVFGGASSVIAGQQLPYDLFLIDPVSVSFSTQIVPGSISQSGGYVTGFAAAGTGEIQGIPEPATLSFLALGWLALRRKPNCRA